MVNFKSHAKIVKIVTLRYKSLGPSSLVSFRGCRSLSDSIVGRCVRCARRLLLRRWHPMRCGGFGLYSVGKCGARLAAIIKAIELGLLTTVLQIDVHRR